MWGVLAPLRRGLPLMVRHAIVCVAALPFRGGAAFSLRLPLTPQEARSDMRRLIALAVAGGALLFAAAACGDDASTSSSPSGAASVPGSTAPVPASLSPQELIANTAAACGIADTIYANLDSTAKEELASGVSAGLSGDDAAAKKALETVTPIYKAASVTFQSESDKARDPNVKTVLKTLSDEYAQAAAVQSIDDFAQIDMQEAEASLKALCAESGVHLQHLE